MRLYIKPAAIRIAARPTSDPVVSDHEKSRSRRSLRPQKGTPLTVFTRVALELLPDPELCSKSSSFSAQELSLPLCETTWPKGQYDLARTRGNTTARTRAHISVGASRRRSPLFAASASLPRVEQLGCHDEPVGFSII
jgi:hypothetical protein